MVAQSNEDFRNIYCCFNEHEVGRLVQILREAELDPMVRDRASTAFPTTVGHSGAQILAVPAHETEQARTVIEDAIRDEVISPEGQFFDED